MADVTLRSTLKKIDALIDGGRYEEAKANTRHVLTQYPKNAHAYFALARVLVAQRQWEEAGEVLRRLLGATPLDAKAHQLLSVVYQNTDQPENALYHLERAFDQQPNDRNIINQLRELYGRYRNTAVEKIQLTAGAVAGQYLNNNLPDQAIDILTKALRRFPDRADLKLLLARAYRTAEQPVDAAETAMDALKTLPYAVPANELMAEFWLEQGRPSDARAYITRIEEVDPYLALKLATGQDDEQRYTLPELDYRRVAERELSATNPDWLSNLQPGEAADDLSWLTDDPAPASAPRKKVTDNLPDLLDDVPASGDGSENIPVDENFTGEISPEVLRRLEALKGIANDGTIVTDARPADRTRDNLNNFLDEIDPAAPPRRRTGFTGLLGALDAQAAKEPEVDEDSWLMEVINASDDEPPAGEVAPEDSGLMSLDFLSDLDPGAPISPQSGRISTGFTDRIDAATPTPAEEPLAEQAHEFDDTAFSFDEVGFEEEPEGDTDALPEPRASFFDSLEFVEDEAPAAPAQPRARGGDDLPASDAADPLAWMRDTGIEYDENAENPFEAMRSLDDADPISPQQVAQDPLAWARDTGGVEIDLEAVAAEEAEKPSTDPLAWMKGLDIEIEEPAPPPGDQDELNDLLQMEVLSTDELNSYIDPASQGDWQDAMTDNANWQDDDLEGFEWLSDDSTDEPAPNPQAEDAPAGNLDWMSEEASSFDWEQESNPQAEAATGFTGMLDNLGAMYGSTEDDPLAWMNKYKTDYLDEAMLGADPTGPQAQHASEAQSAASDVDEQPADVPDFFATADDEQPAAVPDFFATTDDSLDFVEEAAATEGADFAETYEMADDAGAFDFTAQSADDDIPPPETLHEPPVGFTDFDEVLAGPPPAADDFGFEAMSAEATGDDFGFTEEPAAEMTDFDFDMSAEATGDDFGFTEEPAAEMADFDFDMSAEQPADEFGFTEEPAAEMADFDFDMSAEATGDEFGFTEEPAAEMTDFDFDMSAEATGDDFGFTEEPAAEMADFDFDMSAEATGDDFGFTEEPAAEMADFDFDMSAEQPADDFGFGEEPAAEMADFDFDMSAEQPADDFGFTQEPAAEMADFDFDMSAEQPADEFGFTQEPAAEMADFDFDMSAEATGDDFGFGEEPAAEMTDFDFNMSAEQPADEFGFTEEPAADLGDWMPELGTAASMDAQPSLDDVDFGEYAAPEENVSFGFDTAAFEAFEGEQEAVEAPPPAARRQPGDEFSFVDELLEGEPTDEQEEFFLDEFALEQELAGDGFGQEFSMEQGSEEYSDEFNLDEFQLAEEDELAAADLSEFDFGEAQEPGAEPAAEGAADYSFEETNEPDWLGRIDGSSVSAIATEEPDWLAAVGAAPVEGRESGDAYEEAYASDNDTEATADDFDFAQEPAAEMADDFDFDMSAEADELADEPLASNIPDWLNTMAPGLDINYENLPSDDVVEEEFEEGATYRERGVLDEFTAVNDGYEWLTDIVEEESQNVAPVNPAAGPPPPPLAPLPDFSRAGSEAPAEAPAPRSRTRFVFDRLPPWVLKLRGVTQRPPEPVAAADDDDDEFADFDFDDDDLK